MTALPITRLEAHWIEVLDEDHEVVRVLVCAGVYLYRVVPHRTSTWRAEKRERLSFSSGMRWAAVAGAPRGPYKARVTRSWRSPEAAMRAVEAMVDIKVMLEKGEEGR